MPNQQGNQNGDQKGELYHTNRFGGRRWFKPTRSGSINRDRIPKKQTSNEGHGNPANPDEGSRNEIGYHFPGKNGKCGNIMTDELNEQVKESFSEALFYERSMETALKYLNNSNPVERILKVVDTQDETIRKETVERTKMMMQTWLQTYDDVLTAGKSLPVDIIGKAADLARASRKRVKQE